MNNTPLNIPQVELPKDISDHKVGILPVFAHFIQKMGIIEMINRLIPSPENVSSGQAVLCMIMDTLSGRSPLYKLHEFVQGQDTELLFGSAIDPSAFNDNNTGKVLDNIHAYGTSKLFSQLSYRACELYDINTKCFHFDTTSRSVQGDYSAYSEESPNHIAIVHGHSKDNRPDLKQFMIKSLCVNGNIPLLGAVISGNTSDKKANNAELTAIASHLRKHGMDPRTHIYIADSALVTLENLEKLRDQPFISRLPGSFSAEKQLIEEAIKIDKWTNVGPLAEEVDPSKNRLSARYKLHESTVTLGNQQLRAIVCHSDAHNNRKLKKLAKEMASDEKKYSALEKKISKETWNCSEDVNQRIKSIVEENPFKHHKLSATPVEVPVYRRGRPRKGEERQIEKMQYSIKLMLEKESEKIEKLKKTFGCFVLISNVEKDATEAMEAVEILKAYKEQYGIENNFRFLKDPIIVNHIFLKKAGRIEALGLILLLSLLVWNLIQHELRKYLQDHKKDILGWDNKRTTRPTTLMIIYYFQHVSILVWNEKRNRKLTRSLLEHQKEYLQALGLSESIFTTPVNHRRPPKIALEK